MRGDQREENWANSYLGRDREFQPKKNRVDKRCKGSIDSNTL